MWVDRKHIALLEQELAEKKARIKELEAENRALVNTVFAVNGAPAPFVPDEKPPEDVPARKTWDTFQAELEAAAVEAAKLRGDELAAYQA